VNHDETAQPARFRACPFAFSQSVEIVSERHANLPNREVRKVRLLSPNEFRLTGNESHTILNHMVKHMDAHLDVTFAALSDPTRRGILAQLTLGETSVSALAAPYEMSLPAVSKHLRVLQHAGLVTRKKNGRVHRCRLVAEPMKQAAQWIDHYRNFWEAQFDALEKFLDESMQLERDTQRSSSAASKPISRKGRPAGKRKSNDVE
jgi:DNA-binding transcriptional ArsR family regulator